MAETSKIQTMVENLYTPNSIRTRSGIYVDFANLKPEMFIIEDIAHALSMQCRFGGHLPFHYSVAQHSVNVCKVCTDKEKLSGLLHDASEAYLMDIPSPIKPLLKGYYEIEEKIMKIISDKFGFQYPLSEHVKEKDKVLLELEWSAIMIDADFSLYRQPLDTKEIFLKYFRALSK